MKINSFLGDSYDVKAKKEALLEACDWICARLMSDFPFLELIMFMEAVQLHRRANSVCVAPRFLSSRFRKHATLQLREMDLIWSMSKPFLSLGVT